MNRHKCAVFLLFWSVVAAGWALEPVESETVVSGVRRPVGVAFPSGSVAAGSLVYVLERGEHRIDTDARNGRIPTLASTTHVPGRIRICRIRAGQPAEAIGDLWTPPAMNQVGVRFDQVKGFYGVGEAGMLNLVLDPEFATNRFLYVMYSYSLSENRVVRLTVAPDLRSIVEGSQREILAITGRIGDGRNDTEAYHHGSILAFNPRDQRATDGPDGPAGDVQRKHWLYISTGEIEGRSAKDLNADGALDWSQSLGHLKGKILRLNVDPARTTTAKPWLGTVDAPWRNPGADANHDLMPAIAAIGLRNPWRGGFDRRTGDLWIGDVGGSAEEVNRLPYGMTHVNFGYGVGEGVLGARAPSGPGAYMEPVHVDPTAQVTVGIGGFVYRGSALGASWPGRYLYATWGGGGSTVRSLLLKQSDRILVAQPDDFQATRAWLGNRGAGVVGLVEGPDREPYLVRHDGNEICRLRPASQQAPRFAGDPPKDAFRRIPYAHPVSIVAVPEATVEVVAVVPASARGDLAVTKAGQIWRLTWTPASAGTVAVTLRARNAVGATEQQMQLKVLAALPPDLPSQGPQIVPGLECAFYADSGSGTTLEHLYGLVATRSSRQSTIGIPSGENMTRGCGLRFSGLLRITAAGTYRLRLDTAEPARLRLGRASPIDTTSGRPAEAAYELLAGHYRLQVEMLADSERPTLALAWQPPGTSEFAVVPAGNLLRQGQAPALDGYVPRGPYLDGVFPAKLTTANKPPRLLSQTGVFADIKRLRIANGLVPYAPINELWSDGASKSRWMAIPDGERIGFDGNFTWSFPAGTVFIKHFELAGRRLETRALVMDGTGAYGVTYKWNTDQSDAELLDRPSEDLLEPVVGGAPGQRWSYPSQTSCLACHKGQPDDNGIPYLALGVRTFQLNEDILYPSGRRANQLRTLAALGLIDGRYSDTALATYPKAARMQDQSAPLELRVRSYLASNCSSCHIGGSTQECPTLDARFSNPLAASAMIDAPASHANSQAVMTHMKLSGKPVMVVPGKPDVSMLLMRMSRHGGGLHPMPTISRGLFDPVAVPVLEEWIRTLPR